MRIQWEFIEAVGKRLGVEAEALRKWRVRGVPAKYRLSIVDAARDERFRLDRSAFDRPPGSRRSERNMCGCDTIGPSPDD